MLIKFSLILPVYNASKTVIETIDSIHQQQYSNFELIIVDDNSSDETVALITNKIKNMKNVSLIQNNINRGAAYSMNLGVRSSQYEWIGIIDSDAIYPFDWLVKSKRIIEKVVPDVFGGKYEYFISSNPKYFEKVFYEIETRTTDDSPHIYNLKNFKEPTIVGGNMFITKKVYSRIGPFMETIRATYDRLFICNAIENNFNVFYDPNLVAIHPLYNYKNIWDIFNRAIVFNSWRKKAGKYSILLNSIIIKSRIFFIIFTIFFILFMLFNLHSFLFILLVLTVVIYSIRLLFNNLKLYILPGYLLVNVVKKILGIIVFIFPVVVISNDWKKRV